MAVVTAQAGCRCDAGAVSLHRRLLAALAGAALIVPLATGAVAAPAAAAAPASGQALADVVPEVMAFVERARGLRFTRTVRITSMTAAQLKSRLVSESRAPRPPFDTGATFQALHLVADGNRYNRQEASTSADGVLGFYLPGRDELVVRATAATPFARGVLAHELTHALQDQHFDLLAIQRKATDADRYAGVASLYEGDAVTVEGRYRLSLSAADRSAYDREAASAGGGSTSREAQALGAFLSFPYLYGPGLVADLRLRGGQALLDKAFSDPPTSSETVVDPARYGLGLGRRDRPRTLPTPKPPAGSRVADSGTLGAYGIAVVLAEKVPSIGTRSQAALGWAGDRYVTWRTRTGTCLQLKVFADSPSDRAELVSAFRTYVRGYPRSGSRVTADARDARALTLTTCG